MRKAGILTLLGSVVAGLISLPIWLTGIVTGFTAGGFIHLLLVFTIIIVPPLFIAGALMLILSMRNTDGR